MRQVAAVILAAGEAKRFRRSPDETKLVAELEAKPIVRHVAEAALASRAHPTLLVTGHAHAHVLGALDGLLLERIHNRDPGAGLSASLKLAIGALPSSDVAFSRRLEHSKETRARETLSPRGTIFLNCRWATPRLRSTSIQGKNCAGTATLPNEGRNKSPGTSCPRHSNRLMPSLQGRGPSRV